METIQYVLCTLVNIVESPSESRWLWLRGPTIENVKLTGGPTTQMEIWQMKYNSHLRSLLEATLLNNYREGWLVVIPFSHCVSSILYNLSTNLILIIVRRLFRVEAPFLELGEVLNNGTQVPHFRSVVMFARDAPNELAEGRQGEGHLGDRRT